MLFDDVLTKYIGELGPFQLMTILIVTVEEFNSACHTMSPVFTAATPKYSCISMAYPISRNCTDQRCVSIDDELDKCWYRSNTTSTEDRIVPGSHTTEIPADSPSLHRCQKWSYDDKMYGNTMVTEWDLVCDKAWVSKAIASVYLAGMIFGSLVFGWLSDRYGRRTISFVSGVPNAVVGIALAFMPNYTSFIVLRFLHGFLSSGKIAITFVLGTEYIGPSKRVAFGSCNMIVWGVGYISVAGICYLIKDWRTILWVMVIPEIVYYILLYFFVPESPRWLYLRGRKDEADKIMQKIAKFNKVELPEDLEITAEKEDSSGSPLDLFRTPEIRKTSLILAFVWIVNGMTYYGISFNSAAFSGDPYINYVIFGAIEIPAYLYLWAAFQRLGHLWPFSASLILAGLPLLFSLAVPKALAIGSTVLVTISKFFITATYTMLYIYTAEVFPTCVRNQGISYQNTAARISSSLAPYVILLDVYHPATSILIFGTLAILGGIAILSLPETKDKPLVQTISEGEKQMAESHLRLCSFGSRPCEEREQNRKGTILLPNDINAAQKTNVTDLGMEMLLKTSSKVEVQREGHLHVDI